MIKRVHVPERLARGRIRIGTLQYKVGAIIQDDPHGTTWRLLGLMDGARDREQIKLELADHAPGVTAGRIEAAIDRLIDAGFVEDAAAEPHTMSDREVARYASNRHYFAWVDTVPRPSPFFHQERLKHARVTIIGLGGTGTAIAASLAAVGVGRLHCVDGDTVAETNLTRQLLYRESDLGQPKVAVAAEYLRQLNSTISVTSEQLRIDSPRSVERLADDCDLIMLCADTPPGEIQRWVNAAALNAMTSWIISAYNGPMAVLGTFIPGRTACFECIARAEKARQTDPTDQLLFEPAEVNATIAPAANLSGQLASLEAVYLLAGLQPQALGRLYHQDLRLFDHRYSVGAAEEPGCDACGDCWREAGRG